MKENITSLCRIKVNKMLSTLNSENKNIFIPRYTLTNKAESNYLSLLNNKQKQKPKIKSKRINSNKQKLSANIEQKKSVDKHFDFIINHGILVYQRNMKGEEIINYGINKKKFSNKKSKARFNDKSYKTEINFNKKFSELIPPNSKKPILTFRKNDNIINSRKTIDSMSDISLISKNSDYLKYREFQLKQKNKNLNKDIDIQHLLLSESSYNNKNAENLSMNYDHKKDIIKIKKKNSCNFTKTKAYIKTIKNQNNMVQKKIRTNIINLHTKLKKFFDKRKKNIFNLLKYNVLETTETALETDEKYNFKKPENKNKYRINNIIGHKKSNSIQVNKRLSLNTINSRSNSNLKNLPILISDTYKFFYKNKDEPELYRDSKSLEKKYKQICRRKELNKTMTFTREFKENILSNENCNYLSERFSNYSLSNFNDNNSTVYTNTNRIKYNKDYKYSPIKINNSINHEINSITDNTNNIIENHNFKINLIGNENKNDIFRYRTDKIRPINKHISLKFSRDKIIFKEQSFNNTDILRNKIFSYNKYFSRDKDNKKVQNYLNNENKSNKNNKKNQFKFHSIKNICTRDKRININIKYLSYNPEKIKKKNGRIILNISKIFDFHYKPKNPNKKRINKRRNEIKNKLYLIKEEKEKNSNMKLKDTNSLNYHQKIGKQILAIKNMNCFNLNLIKLVNILDKKIYMRKYESFLRISKFDKNKEIKKFKKNISNIIIKDKIFLNNFFINNDKSLFGSRSLDLDREFNIIDSSSLKKIKRDANSKDNIHL